MNYEDDELERMRARREGRKQPVPVRQGILRAAVLLPAPAAEESAVQSKIAREKVRRAAVQYVPATAVLRALEVEKRVRDAAAAITVNRRATESI